MTRYVALVDGAPGAFGVVIPDLPGCTSAGDTVDEALANAVEALRVWIEDARADGEDIPAPRDFGAMHDDPEIAGRIRSGAALALVPVLIDSGRPAKANVSIDSGLLQAVDDAARVRGLTRSAFLASAARDKIAAES